MQVQRSKARHRGAEDELAREREELARVRAQLAGAQCEQRGLKAEADALRRALDDAAAAAGGQPLGWLGGAAEAAARVERLAGVAERGDPEEMELGLQVRRLSPEREMGVGGAVREHSGPCSLLTAMARSVRSRAELGVGGRAGRETGRHWTSWERQTGRQRTTGRGRRERALLSLTRLRCRRWLRRRRQECVELLQRAQAEAAGGGSPRPSPGPSPGPALEELAACRAALAEAERERDARRADAARLEREAAALRAELAEASEAARGGGSHGSNGGNGGNGGGGGGGLSSTASTASTEADAEQLREMQEQLAEARRLLHVRPSTHPCTHTRTHKHAALSLSVLRSPSSCPFTLAHAGPRSFSHSPVGRPAMSRMLRFRGIKFRPLRSLGVHFR